MPARRTREEKTLDKQLREVEGLKRRLTELREWRALAIRGPIGAIGSWPGPGPYAGRGYTPDEIAALEGVSSYVAECDAAIAEVEARIAEAWALAGGLQDAPGRLASSDDELAGQIAALETRRESLVALQGRFREDEHDRLDSMLAEHVARFEALLSGVPDAFAIEEAAKLWPLGDRAFVERLHRAVDGRPDSEFATGARASWRSELDTVNRQLARRHAEVNLREQEREAREAEARRAEAEIALAETT